MNNQHQASPQTPPRRVSDLRPKMKLTGRVEKVELFGAVVDIGYDHPALLHNSQMGGKPTILAEKKIRAGEEITVWVHKVSSQSGRIEITLIEPIAVEWHELKPGQVREGKVVRLEKFGVFVDIGAERAGLVHIRELTTGRVDHPSDVVVLGEKVEVKVVAVDPKKQRVNLSMRALEVDPVEDDKEEWNHLTSLGAALRTAMDGEETKIKQPRRKREKVKQASANREELLRRTLDQHSED